MCSLHMFNKPASEFNEIRKAPNGQTYIFHTSEYDKRAIDELNFKFCLFPHHTKNTQKKNFNEKAK